ncbi:MAG: hypothetical protein ACFFCZ_31350 [Promethearchaeota archaeon]
MSVGETDWKAFWARYYERKVQLSYDEFTQLTQEEKEDYLHALFEQLSFLLRGLCLAVAEFNQLADDASHPGVSD